MVLAVRLREAVSLADRFPLLAGVTLDVAEGEVVHLRGPNGAGKSSLLRLCAGLAAVTSGTAVVLGHDLCVDRQSLRREVGLLGHSSFLYEDLSVERNVVFAVRAARADVAGVDAALDRLGLVGRLRTTLVGNLSAGQRRRAALAVVVARAARLWLLDEPHAGLDAEGRTLVDDLVRDASRRGTTVLLASHELDRAADLADRTVAVVGGRVVVGELPGERRGAATGAAAPAGPAGGVRAADAEGVGCDVA
jgi:heme ABC exporter ATP-binding subunit CcmA